MSIRPIRAEDVLVMDGILGTSDPYLVLSYEKKRFESREIKQTVNPEWDSDSDEMVFSVEKVKTRILINLFDRTSMKQL